MNYPIDIIHKIEIDFGNKAPEAFEIIEANFVSIVNYNDQRAIRCILFLVEKDLDKLKHFIKAAAADPRDVILWAEYANRGQGEQVIRLRDFNKPFEQADINI